MSKKSEVKEEIGVLKFWLGILVGIIVAIIGWVATSYKTADTPITNSLTNNVCGFYDYSRFATNQNI